METPYPHRIEYREKGCAIFSEGILDPGRYLGKYHPREDLQVLKFPEIGGEGLRIHAMHFFLEIREPEACGS